MFTFFQFFLSKNYLHTITSCFVFLQKYFVILDTHNLWLYNIHTVQHLLSDKIKKGYKANFGFIHWCKSLVGNRTPFWSQNFNYSKINSNSSDNRYHTGRITMHLDIPLPHLSVPTLYIGCPRSDVNSLGHPYGSMF